MSGSGFSQGRHLPRATAGTNRSSPRGGNCMVAPFSAFGVPDLAPTFLLAGLFLLTYAVFARTFPMVSPRLAEITIRRELGHHAVETFDHEDQDKDFLHAPEIEGASE